MKMKILICEDDPNVVTVISRMLEPLTSVIEAVDNIADCLRIVAHFNVLIIDLRLLDSDVHATIEAIKAIHELQPRPGIVVVTGYADEETRQQCLNAGADAFVPKDNNFQQQAILVALNVAVMNIEPETQKTPSYEGHVMLLHQLVHQ